MTATGFPPGNSVVSPRDEVVSVGGELRVPHGIVVPLVAHEARERLQAPQSDRSVLRTRQQVVPKEKARGVHESKFDLRTGKSSQEVVTSL